MDEAERNMMKFILFYFIDFYNFYSAKLKGMQWNEHIFLFRFVKL